MKKFFSDFKAFIAKGNVIDMAVGVVIGGAFGKIVTALVNNIIMPLVGLLTGGTNIADLQYELSPANILAYGLFIQSIIDFLLVALSIFIFLRIMLSVKGKFEKKQQEEAPTPTPEEPKETAEDILADIRELLKK
ncbi:MAG: large-conductance mechanosensitive channel protein MscL [Clostridia bacterium]|nr:large-conductance mechanosensitive channel protein MscL [Clostridia bacterium]